jgi:hypothetical protein
MNLELHKLLWYTKAELVQIRKRNTSVWQKDKNTTGWDDNRENIYDEITGILSGVIITIDDVLKTGSSAWNSLLLANIIQAFNVHLSTLQRCHFAAEALGYTMLGLDNNYTRVRCHVQTVLDMIKANLVVLCSSAAVSVGRRTNLKVDTNFGDSNLTRPPTNLTRSPSNLTRSAPDLIRSFSNLDRSSGSKSLIESTAPVAPNTVPLFRRSTSSVNNALQGLCVALKDDSCQLVVKDMLVQHTRLRSKLSSKNLIEAHQTANIAMASAVEGEYTRSSKDGLNPSTRHWDN